MARYYDSRTGAFLVADPVTGKAGDPQSWNRYPYGRNDPIDVTDPSGKSWWSDLIGAALWIADPFTGMAITPLAEAYTMGNTMVEADLAFNRGEIGRGAFDLGNLALTGFSFYGSTGAGASGSEDPMSESLGMPKNMAANLGAGIYKGVGMPGLSSGCEFGACGAGGFGFQSGNSKYDFTFWHSVGELAGAYDFYSGLWHLGKFNANAHQVTYEHWCGPGGSGSDLSGHDSACHVHDNCYDGHQLKIYQNFDPLLSSGAAANLQRCNQQLCDATKGSLVDKYFSSIGSPLAGRCR